MFDTPEQIVVLQLVPHLQQLPHTLNPYVCAGQTRGVKPVIQSFTICGQELNSPAPSAPAPETYGYPPGVGCE